MTHPPFPGASRARRFWRWATLVPIALSLLVLGAAFNTGIKSGVSRTTSMTNINLIGLAAVISSKDFGLTRHPYAGFTAVKDALFKAGLAEGDSAPKNYADPTVVANALKAGTAADVCGSTLNFHPENDQGSIDFLRAAFTVFGINVSSVYYFYFVIVAISVIFFLWEFWQDYGACLLLVACACAIYSFMPHYLIDDSNLLSVGNYRFLTTLGIIPLLHILLLIWRNDARLGWRDLLPAIGQIAIVYFALAIRSTTLWMFIAIAALFAIVLAKPVLISLRQRDSGALQRAAMRRVPLAMIIVAIVMALGTTHDMYMVPPCGTSLNSHPLWHSIFVGYTIDPDWKTRFQPQFEGATGDELPGEAARLYVEEHHLPYQTRPTIWVRTAQTERTSADPMPFGSWLTYETLIRKATIEFAVRHPRFVLEDFLFYKPLHLASDLADFMATVRMGLTPLVLLSFVVIAALLAILAPAGRPQDVPVSGLMAVLILAFFASTIPLLVAYSLTFLIADQAYLLVAIIVAAILLAARYATAAVLGLVNGTPAHAAADK